MSTLRQQRSVLSIRERNRYRKELEMRRAQLRGQLYVPTNGNIKEGKLSRRREGRFSQFLRSDVKEDPALVNAKIRKLERVLENGTPRPLSRRERSEVEKQIKHDRAYLKKHMCSEKLFRLPANHPDFELAKKAVSREHTPEFQRVASRYKTNMRTVETEDPRASNIETLRPKS